MDFKDDDGFDKFRREVIDCSMDIQRLMMNVGDHEKVMGMIEAKYDKMIIRASMELLDSSKYDTRSPLFKVHNELSKVITENGGFDQACDSIEDFYEFSVNMYKSVSKNKTTRALPILFMYGGVGKKIGVAPIQGNDNESPADSVKSILFKASPEAYIFCAEAGSLELPKEKGKSFEKNYKRGDVLNNPDVKDIVICKGNNKMNTKQYMRVFNIKEKNGEIQLIRDLDIERSEWKSDKF